MQVLTTLGRAKEALHHARSALKLLKVRADSELSTALRQAAQSGILRYFATSRILCACRMRCAAAAPGRRARACPGQEQLGKQPGQEAHCCAELPARHLLRWLPPPKQPDGKPTQQPAQKG